VVVEEEVVVAVVVVDDEDSVRRRREEKLGLLYVFCDCVEQKGREEVEKESLRIRG
jgi:hypothetical protein